MKRIISCLVSLAILLSLNSTVFAMDINTTSSSAVDTSADVVFIYLCKEQEPTLILTTQ